ncbi:argininosuccinate synthase [Candidatus Micrarchaeota archaeon]|nr:argininosuccinate synthase [Candidatus Micrarchaeota archaeon]
MDLIEKIHNKTEYRKHKKVVLAYSGGLDTSILLTLLQDLGLQVATVTVDLGQKEYREQGMAEARQKALKLGAIDATVIDGKEEFAQDYVTPAVHANCLYQGTYPCSTALGRPLIAKYLVQEAEKTGAGAVVHGSTGKGNDYLRFEVSVKALAPQLEVLAPVRDWQLNREEELEYAVEKGIPVPIKKTGYSVDANLWGRSVCGGSIEIEDQEVPTDALDWVKPLDATPDAAQVLTLTFDAGTLAGAELDGTKMLHSGAALIEALNRVVGNHGIGIIDQIEDRVIGLKSREYYECPAALAVIAAHADLEKTCLPKELNQLKMTMDQKFAEYAYGALWHSPVMDATRAFMDATQANVNGWVKLKLFKGGMHVIARKAPDGLYQRVHATYGRNSTFDQRQSAGFGALYALSTTTARHPHWMTQKNQEATVHATA